MDYALLGFLATISLPIVAFLFRKRILAALGRLLFDGAVKFARAEFIEELDETTPDGQKRVLLRLRPRGEALVGAVLASAVKNIKFKLPGGPGVLPAGIDITNLSEMLPAILPMIPKKYQGIAALAMPFLGPLLGGLGKPGTGTKPGGKETPNPFLKELTQ